MSSFLLQLYCGKTPNFLKFEIESLKVLGATEVDGLIFFPSLSSFLPFIAYSSIIVTSFQ